ncbi:hypothetical protein NQZ68_006256 [Dissostichus eleginoides]|nr:hypothetical protein NQZ68_006256 [Dissostichus eleginoides]
MAAPELSTRVKLSSQNKSKPMRSSASAVSVRSGKSRRTVETFRSDLEAPVSSSSGRQTPSSSTVQHFSGREVVANEWMIAQAYVEVGCRLREQSDRHVRNGSADHSVDTSVPWQGSLELDSGAMMSHNYHRTQVVLRENLRGRLHG